MFAAVLVLSKDPLKLFLANYFELAVPTACCGPMRDKESGQETRMGHPGLSGHKIIFEADHAAHVTENQWE